MDSKQTLSTWDAATRAWDEGGHRDSLNSLLQIEKPNSKIFYNIGCAYYHLDNYGKAEQAFTSTITKDEHMAIAYFQRACVLIKANRCQDALADLEECSRRFRGRAVIDYSQLGLKYKLYLCEARHNSGVAEAILGHRAQAEQYLEKAIKAKVELRHKKISQSLDKFRKGALPSLIEIPPEAIYRPPQAKLANMGQVDYLGKAKVISAVDHEDKFSGFVGPKKVEGQRRQSPSASPVGSPMLNQRGLKPSSHHPRDQMPSQISPTMEQLMAASRDLSPKLKHLQINNSNGLHTGSKDDLSLKPPQHAAPLLPPRLLEQRRGSEGILRIMDNSRNDPLAGLPPPPNRPPPKLDRKPLPQLPNESSASRSTGKGTEE